MDKKERAFEFANELFDKLCHTTSLPVIKSWGIVGTTAGYMHEDLTLCLTLDTLRFKGKVYISLVGDRYFTMLENQVHECCGTSNLSDVEKIGPTIEYLIEEYNSVIMEKVNAN